ncbi:MAG: SBBP repeat-containing protein, partial [Candidatus Eisenbacteria bacterium]|nr:SBBP repeat-containing protein [Candidatus Eisenbacteria bacterium]
CIRDRLWVRRYDSGNGEDVPAAIACDASGIYVTGRSNSDYTTIKYDFDGSQQWLRSYNGPGNGSDAPAAMIGDADGNIYVTGQSWGAGTNFDYATIKYDAAGNEQWVRRYDGPATVFDLDFDYAAALALDGDGNVLVTGNSSDDFATVKYDASGTETWVRAYDGPGAGVDWATSIAVDAAGNSYVCGSSYGDATTQYDFATLSYDPAGTVRWTERYNGPGNFYDTAYSIGVHSSGEVYVTGSSGGTGTGLDYATIKYAPGTATAPSGPIEPRGGLALRSDPNPFTPATTISFTIPAGTDREHVRLAVYDVSGKEVALLVNGELVPGTYARELKGSGLPTGVYWSRLQAGGASEVRKLIRVR